MTQGRECGHEIPDDLDFCPACGRMRDSGPEPPPESSRREPPGQGFFGQGEGQADGRADGSDRYGTYGNVCPNCGRVYEPGSVYCGGCGTKLPTSQGPMDYQMPRMGRREQVAVILAFIPGFFNIFGLGHLVVKSYARGVSFLLISLVMWYINGWSFMPESFWMVLLELLIYFYQAMDIMRVIAMGSAR